MFHSVMHAMHLGCVRTESKTRCRRNCHGFPTAVYGGKRTLIREHIYRFLNRRSRNNQLPDEAQLSCCCCLLPPSTPVSVPPPPLPPTFPVTRSHSVAPTFARALAPANWRVGKPLRAAALQSQWLPTPYPPPVLTSRRANAALTLR